MQRSHFTIHPTTSPLIPLYFTLLQVEAALTTDPNNEELIKLKFDLKEVIKLTHDLIKSQQQEKRQANGMDAKDPILLAVLANKWKIGDQCMAPWSEDGKWVEFIILFIIESRLSCAMDEIIYVQHSIDT